MPCAKQNPFHLIYSQAEGERERLVFVTFPYVCYSIASDSCQCRDRKQCSLFLLWLRGHSRCSGRRWWWRLVLRRSLHHHHLLRRPQVGDWVLCGMTSDLQLSRLLAEGATLAAPVDAAVVAGSLGKVVGAS